MNQALQYAKLGLSIFPVYEPIGINVCSCGNTNCSSIGKHPRTYDGLKAATTNEQTIREWWTKWPNANIGMATGINDIGIVDLDGAVGLESGKKMNLHSLVNVRTGSGGAHLWYRVPEGKKLVTRAKKIAPGVDTRGSGGFVVLPPSLHKSGSRYIWGGALPKRELLPMLPDQFVDINEMVSSTNRLRPPTWVDDALNAFEAGHVANTLVSLLGKFRAHNFSEDVTFKLLQPRNKSGEMTDQELRDKIQEIWTRYPTVEISSNATEDIDKFLEHNIEVEWICKPFIAKKLIGFVVGLPETLKTWIVMDLAIECARTSGLWLGRFPITQSRVMFVDQERFKGETQRRLNALIAAKGLTRSELRGKLSIKCGTTIRLDLEESFQAFRRELLEIKPEIVMVDSFATFHNSPENDRMAIQQVLNKIKQLRDETGCSFLFINHENKSAYPNGEPQGEPHIGTMAGSVGIIAAAEFALTVRKVEAGTSMVWHTKSTVALASKPFYANIQDVENGITVRAVDA